ncbi:RsmE family RNA methyltransferase, partial [candidate division WOR-3 bacterium]|nr:RsmE family RNA methyltransferase [candidate division WOR-3 bacterium]
MRSVFYCLKQNEKYIFDNNEKHHINVLRIKLPSTLLFTTGDGILYSGEVDADYNILSHRIIKETSNEFINIFFGICEKSRMKYILEKCTELGVKSFTPLFTDNSEKFH